MDKCAESMKESIPRPYNTQTSNKMIQVMEDSNVHTYNYAIQIWEIRSIQRRINALTLKNNFKMTSLMNNRALDTNDGIMHVKMVSKLYL